ncbi:protein FAR-RED ELONGATED HYPOCOTYL 3 isoform X1 [Sorghum bicolor]|uniref:protein FAR-RED ELONGATED HYPOCOTYL 3 isoform X1 n=1 Tax=Sorghum bicolor TaxID=4558 RepID=UPI000B425605|nr:protein FAR-RED ELONGATED HYPOCOTYL 3 isoform X1 [Sorghum bicolor]|eukprot:XP_021319973.1 protein FAR-RED ELONGATED HYPOCOTYL 3 isoform X1 [Sorghum bicolor]
MLFISFLREYQRIIEAIDRAENLEDHYSSQKKPKELLFGYMFEKQAHELYNRNVYKKFQIQLKATSTMTYQEIEEGKAFEVWQRRNQVHQIQNIRKYTVLTDLTEGKEQFDCICAKFSKDGILCSHVLKIIIEKEISNIPEMYIIDRWRKKEMRMLKQPMGEDTIATSSLLRYNVLSRKSTVLNSKAAKREEATNYLMAEMDRIEAHLNQLLEPPARDQNHNEETANQEIQTQATSVQNEIEDPETATQKGRPELPKRMKTQIEKVREKMRQQEIKKKKKETTHANSSTISHYQSSPSKQQNKRMRKSATKNTEGRPSN